MTHFRSRAGLRVSTTYRPEGVRVFVRQEGEVPLSAIFVLNYAELDETGAIPEQTLAEALEVARAVQQRDSLEGGEDAPIEPAYLLRRAGVFFPVMRDEIDPET